MQQLKKNRMAKKDYIPSKESEYQGFMSNLAEKSADFEEKYGIPEADVGKLLVTYSVWDEYYEKCLNKETRTREDIVEKNFARKNLTKVVRNFVNKNLIYNDKITDSEKVSLGLNLRPGTRTQTQVPTSTPQVMKIDITHGMQHVIYIVDDETGRKAKPEGVSSCEIWYKVTETEPEHASELVFGGLTTKTPYRQNFTGEEGGKMVYYRLRWVNSKGEFGPWSAYAKAVVLK